ncbi:MAG: hypothetical protein WCL34_11020 [Methylococcaceae bacterium]
MIKNVKNVLLIAVMGFTAAWTSVASAGDDYVTVKIESISVMGVNAFGHKAGNMELKIKGGFSPSGVNCSHDYLTTLKTSDPDRAMLSLLRDAYNSNRTVGLRITDDTKYTAYSGRCSVSYVTE